MNWNDLRYVLALRRGQTVAAAAKRLGVDDTTVSRRLAALQSSLGVRIFDRSPDGRLELTAEGHAVADRAEIMEHQAYLIAATPADDDGCAGTVRVTAVPVIVNRLLVPGIGALVRQHPALRVELIAESRDYSLTRREADLALRLARPRTGGTQVKARKLATLTYAAYAASGLSDEDAANLPWITYDEAMAHLPQARWIAGIVRAERGALSPVRVHDAETALAAALAGLGRTLLPRAIADNEPGLRRIETTAGSDDHGRELWLLGHADQLCLPRVAAVVRWLDGIANGTGEPLGGGL